MHSVSITQAFLLGILAVAPFAFGAPVGDQGLTKREVGMRDVPPPDEFGAWERRDVPPPDEFGSWEDKRDVPPPDEFGSWEKRDAELEVRHHTEAQIAAKERKAAAEGHQKRHHTEAQIAAKEAAAAAKQCQRKRSPHHTEAQIAAKEAAAAAAAASPTTTSPASTSTPACE